MAAVSLISLPKELLRQICGNLPCPSALEFLLVCRYIYHVCDDWTVWRQVARQQVATYIPNSGKTDTWKRYVVAATKAAKLPGGWTEKDFQDYLPQLAALAHPEVLEGPFLSLHKFYNLERPSGDEELTYAAAFSVTIRHLSLSNADFWSDKPPQLEGESLFDTYLDEKIQPSRRSITLQHSLASRAVGALSARIRSARAQWASHRVAKFKCAHGEPIRIPTFTMEPPSATSIPLPRHIDLPQPFMPNSLENFSTCHLRTMTDPQFFVSGEWIGYVESNYLKNRLLSVGCRHPYDGFSQPEDLALRYENFLNGQPSEDIVRFHLVEGEDNGNQYTLQSNNFHSTQDLHSIRMTVERKTGRLVIHHRQRSYAPLEIMGGMITPFGIIANLHEIGQWLWFWKTEWSIPRPCSCITQSSPVSQEEAFESLYSV